MRAEKAFLQRGIPISMAPVPRHISSDCGIAIRFPASFEKNARDAAAEENITIGGVYDEKPA